MLGMALGLASCTTIPQGDSTADASGESGNGKTLRPLERPVDVRVSVRQQAAEYTDTAEDKSLAQSLLSDKSAASDQGAVERLVGGQTPLVNSQPDGPAPFADRSKTTRVPSLATGEGTRQSGDSSPAPKLGRETIDARVNPLPLPAFIDVVFGQMLATPYTTGPGISNRTEVVQLRSAGEMEAAVFLDLVTMALKDYGVRITTENGVFQVLEDQELKSRTPQFIKSRARMSVPSDLRPVVQFVELNAIDANAMTGILRQALGRGQDSVAIDAATDSNFVILTGLPGDIDTALDIIYQMDELDYAGTQVQRYTPAFWNARELQQEMREILEAEGWQASVSTNLPKTILMLAIDYSNDLMIFTRSSDAHKRVNYWLRELDQPTPQGDVPELFVYNVQNLDAELLASTVNQVLSGQGSGPAVNRPNGVLSGNGIGSGGSFGTGGPAAGGGQTDLPGGGKTLVVDQIGNRLIYSGTASDYQRLLPLLQQLDRAPAEVLIEATIADISLNAGLSFGVDWSVNNIGDPIATPRVGAREISQPGAGGSAGSSGQNLFDNPIADIAGGGGGLTGIIANNNVQAQIQAAANNGDVRILSTPRIVTRSGSSAQIQVGSDIPVISSQATCNVEVGNGILGLTSIEYRSTGILLSIEPVVYGNNRIDLTVSQELSNSTAGSIAGIPSPVISNTSVSTELSLADGSTAVIGGLIQETQDISDSGVPFLKDIPGLGVLFSSKAQDTTKREVVILITAYVLQGQDDKDAVVNEFTRSFNRTSERSRLITLRPNKF